MRIICAKKCGTLEVDNGPKARGRFANNPDEFYKEYHKVNWSYETFRGCIDYTVKKDVLKRTAMLVVKSVERLLKPPKCQPLSDHNCRVYSTVLIIGE